MVSKSGEDMRDDVGSVGFWSGLLARLVPKRKSKPQPVPQASASLWEELHPDKPCLLDEMSPEKVAEFNTDRDRIAQSLEGSSYQPQPEGRTIDDLFNEVERSGEASEPVVE